MLLLETLDGHERWCARKHQRTSSLSGPPHVVGDCEDDASSPSLGLRRSGRQPDVRLPDGFSTTGCRSLGPRRASLQPDVRRPDGFCTARCPVACARSWRGRVSVGLRIVARCPLSRCLGRRVARCPPVVAQANVRWFVVWPDVRWSVVSVRRGPDVRSGAWGRASARPSAVGWPSARPDVREPAGPPWSRSPFVVGVDRARWMGAPATWSGSALASVAFCLPETSSLWTRRAVPLSARP